MEVEQHLWTARGGWKGACGTLADGPELVLVFGHTEALAQGEILGQVRAMYPEAAVYGCSTAGEIMGERVRDESVGVTAVRFAAGRAVGATVRLSETSGSREAGQALAGMLDSLGLAHVLVFSEGLKVNGSELAKGLSQALPTGVGVSGGLAGDGARFGRTLVVSEGRAVDESVSVVGLYSQRLQVGCGSVGGWDSFGPERLITRSEGNVLFELDGKPALGLYKKYLGRHAEGLPSTGLLFPLCLRLEDGGDGEGVVRTILGVDEAGGSMTFAGDVPEGAYARLMKANKDRLVGGAEQAAATCLAGLTASPPQLALLVSCVGRKLVLGQRVEEEVEAVAEALGPQAALAGFYSYGEISPFSLGGACELHNQTMTVTTLAEG